MSDRELAKLLGYDRTMLSHLRAGRRTPTREFISAVIHIFPELMPEVLVYLRDNEEISLVEV